MKLFIAFCAGLGFSMIAVGYASYKMEKEGRYRGVALKPNTRFNRMLFSLG
jgi:hypothetical protein